MHLTTIFDRQTTAVGMENCTPTMERKDTHTLTRHTSLHEHTNTVKKSHTFIFRAKRVRAAKTALSKTK